MITACHTLVCSDDADATRAFFRGAMVTSDIADRSFGLVTSIAVPGADDVMLYQPKHALALDL